MNIALISNKADYDKCFNLHVGINSLDYKFFTVINLPPYLVDINLDLENFSKWKDYEVKDLRTSRFWMDNYNELNVIVSKFIKDNSLNNNYFKFGLVMSFPWEILLPLYEFGEFIKKNNVERVLINKEHCNLVNILSEFIENSGVILEYYQ
jgi:hypothetical protein